jgi:hypothetical protein
MILIFCFNFTVFSPLKRSHNLSNMKSIEIFLLLNLAVAIVVARPNDEDQSQSQESREPQNHNNNNHDDNNNHSNNNNDNNGNGNGNDNNGNEGDVYEDPCNVEPTLMEKCSSTAEGSNFQKCFSCVLDNCLEIASKPEPNCTEIIKCVTDANCSPN